MFLSSKMSRHAIDDVPYFDELIFVATWIKDFYFKKMAKK